MMTVVRQKDRRQETRRPSTSSTSDQLAPLAGTGSGSEKPGESKRPKSRDGAEEDASRLPNNESNRHSRSSHLSTNSKQSAPMQRSGSRSRNAEAKHRAKATPSLSRAVRHFDAMQQDKGVRRMGSFVSGYHERVESSAKQQRRRSLPGSLDTKALLVSSPPDDAKKTNTDGTRSRRQSLDVRTQDQTPSGQRRRASVDDKTASDAAKVAAEYAMMSRRSSIRSCSSGSEPAQLLNFVRQPRRGSISSDKKPGGIAPRRASSVSARRQSINEDDNVDIVVMDSEFPLKIEFDPKDRRKMAGRSDKRSSSKRKGVEFDDALMESLPLYLQGHSHHGIPRRTGGRRELFQKASRSIHRVQQSKRQLMVRATDNYRKMKEHKRLSCCIPVALGLVFVAVVFLVVFFVVVQPKSLAQGNQTIVDATDNAGLNPVDTPLQTPGSYNEATYFFMIGSNGTTITFNSTSGQVPVNSTAFNPVAPNGVPLDVLANPKLGKLYEISGSALEQNDSPQWKAATWLQQYDSMDLQPDDPRFVPRYVLVTLYYALSGYNWKRVRGWLGGDDICQWEGVCCLDATLMDCFSADSSQDRRIRLKLDENDLAGPLPQEISFFTDLLYVDLRNNSITGSLPTSIGRLTKLQSLNLDFNRIEGPVPSTLADATQLLELSVHHNLLSGSLPDRLGELQQLQSLDLGDNQLSGAIPDSLGGLTSLSILHLGTNKLFGQIPASLYGLANLAELNLFENTLTGTLSEEIQNMRNLQVLKLFSNQITGTIPSSIGNCITLESVQLHNNRFSGSIPTELGAIPSLTYLYLDDNELVGKLPNELSNLANLTYFDAFDNGLSGEIPFDYGNLVALNGLDLHSNKLTGSIPVSFYRLSQLDDLDLSQNQLHGTLQPGMWQLHLLANVDLHQNSLSGTLPKVLSMDALQVLDLEQNKLQGTIPTQLASAPNLRHVYLRYNDFTGSVDQGICQMISLVDLWMDCGSSGKVQCSCCHKCD